MYSERERGMVLVIVLFFILLLTTTATYFMLTSLSEIKMVRRQNNSTKAFYLAEAGVQLAVAALNNYSSEAEWDDDEWTTPTGGPYTKTVTSFQGASGSTIGDFTISVTNPTGSTPHVDAIGYVPSSTASDKIERAVRVNLEKSVSPSFAYCIFTQSDLTLEDITTGVEGDVHSNGNIENKGVTVDGTGTAVGAISGSEHFDNYEEDASEVTIPALDMSYYETNKDVLHSGGWPESGTYDLSGKIHYVTGDFTASGATIIGPGTIVATGTIKMGEGTVVGSVDGIVGLFSNSDSEDGAVKIETGSTCYTAIFAPNGGVKIEGPEETPVSVYGSIVAKSAKIEAASQLVYMDSSDDVALPGSAGFSISSWYEQ